MDVKTILSDPAQAMHTLGIAADSQDGRRLSDIVGLLRAGRDRFKQCKDKKSAISAQFKHSNKDSDEYQMLLEEMQATSTALKTIDQDNKLLEKEINAIISACSSAQNIAEPALIRIAREKVYGKRMLFRELAPQELPFWYEFVARHSSSAYHQRAWSDLIERTFGNRTVVLAAFSEQGDMLGGIPLTIFSSKLFGQFAVSIPYFNYGGMVSPWFDVATHLLQELEKFRSDNGLSHIEVRTMQQGLGKDSSSKKSSMVLALPNSDAQLEEELSAKVRAQYKKAEIHQPVIVFGKLDLLNDFYQVFSRNMRDLGTPVYSKNWFANILSEENIKSQLAVVYVNRKPVSCGFLVGYKNMLEIPWASTVKEANATNSNMWMYRQILAYAIREGYEFFDFGRSTRDAGTYKFKKQWGAQPYTHYWYYVTPHGAAMPELNPDNPKYKLMIATWKRMPVWLTRIIGPAVIKNIP